MSDDSSKPISRRRKHLPDQDSVDMLAVQSALAETPLTPRTPKTARGRVRGFDDDEDDTEMRLLGAVDGQPNGIHEVEDEEGARMRKTKQPLTLKDKKAMALLCLLYLIQGVPLGLALGSIPFILRDHLSYSQLGTFSLSGYPYSLKLLWSPIVDAVFIRKIGRRKTWIVPMQLVIATIMLIIASSADALMRAPQDHIWQLTGLFTTLVFIAATQDIAVDGWALTLLSQDNLSYASTCQTFGLNTGYFASFTVFMALNSEDFATKWGIPRLTLATYLKFWAAVCFLVTIWLLFFTREDPPPDDDEGMNLGKVYKVLWSVVQLKHVQALCLMHFVCKIGFQANESVTSLKMTEKGLKKEDLALAVLIDFPFQLVGGYLAAKWARGSTPLEPWLIAFWGRLFFAVVAMLVIIGFPAAPLPISYFLLIILVTIMSNFASTVQFVGISAFHTRISDPVIGGTYMTLLNTATNLGGTWPKYFVLRGVDIFSIATCHVEEQKGLAMQAFECVSEQGKAQCTELEGNCVVERDGYFIVSSFCVALGVLTLLFYIVPTARRLQGLPTSKWRVRHT